MTSTAERPMATTPDQALAFLETGSDSLLPSEHTLASIARTAFDNSAFIPLTESSRLHSSNSRVKEIFGSEARHLTILGPDVVQIGADGPIEVLDQIRDAELLGYLVMARTILPPEEYLNMGFFPESTSKKSRGVTLNSSVARLQNNLLGADGRPIITWNKKGSGQTPLGLGMPDVVVMDRRRSSGYESRREAYATKVMENYILSGGSHPATREAVDARAASRAIRDLSSVFDSKNPPSKSQLGRMELVNAKQAEMRGYRQTEEEARTSSQAQRNAVVELFEPEWHSKAACRTMPNMLKHFFTPSGETKPERDGRIETAKQICAGCPVRIECAEAGEKTRFGIWAGEVKGS